MRALEIAAGLEGFQGRGAGTDAERRAAKWLAKELERGGREVAVEQFWGRPNWPLAQAWHVALALAGSLVEVSSPRVGGAMLLAALVFVLADVFTGYSPGRWLTRQRASQNVVAVPAPGRRSDAAGLRLVLTANYDAGRAGLPFRDLLRGSVAAMRKKTGARVPGWLGWLAIAIVWLLIVAIVRVQGHHSTAIGVIQIPPTIGLVLGLALLLDLATSEFGPAAGDNGTGVGVALELARVLDATPPRNIEVVVVLTGASDREGVGLRRYLKAHSDVIAPTNTAVIGIAACTAGRPCWWRGEGPLIPLRPAPRLRAIAARVTQTEPDLGVIAHADRSATPALAALIARIPAITIGAVEDRGVAPRSHQAGDTAEAIQREAVERVVELGLTLVDAIDAELGQRRGSGAATPA